MATTSLSLFNAVFSSGKFGGSISSGYANTPTGAMAACVTSGKMSVAVWAKFPATGGIQIAYGSGSWGYIGLSASGYATFNVLANNTTILGNASLADGAWHYFVATYDGTNLAGYVDGVLIKSVAIAGVLTTSTAGSGVRFGVRSMADSGFTLGAGGAIDSVAIYNAVIDGTVVPASATVGNEAGLVGLWQLDGTGASGLLAGNFLTLYSTTNVLALNGATFGGNGPFSDTECLTGGYGVTPEGIAAACIAANAMSWRVRVKSGAVPASPMVAMGTTGFGWFGINPSGNMQVSVNGAPVLMGTANLCDGNFHDMMLCYNNTTGTLDGYADGVWLGQATVTGLLTDASIGSSVAMGIGAFENGANAWSGGGVAEVEIYASAIATGDVHPVVPSAPAVGNEAGLLALYHLDGTGAHTGPNISAGDPSYALSVNGSDLALANGFAQSPSGVLAGAAETGQFTIVADGVRSGVPGAYEAIAGMTGLGSLGVNASGYAQIQLASGNTVISTGAFVADGHEHIMQMSYDSALNTLYAIIDGVLSGTAQVGQGIPASVVATGRLGIRSMDTGASVFSGQVRQVSVWTTVLDRIAYADTGRVYSGMEPGLAGLWPLNGSGTDLTTTDVETVPHSDASIYFSKNNWAMSTAGYAMTICAGAYFKQAFTGDNVVLVLNTAYLGFPRSQLYWSIDGQPPVKAEAASTIYCPVPAATLTAPWHVIEVYVKSTSEGLLRWSDTAPTAIMIESIVLDSGASVKLPNIRPLLVEFNGDSITEGVRTLGETATYDTDRNDSLATWAMAVGRALNAEVTMRGFGGSGMTGTGSGSIPPLPTLYPLVTPGYPRDWQTAPDITFFNEGTNDQGATSASFQSAAVGVLTTALNNYPSTKIVPMIPFNQAHAADWRAIAATLNNTRIALIDTTGFVDPGNGIDSLGLHPTAANDVGFIAPRILQAAQKVVAATQLPSYVYS